MRDFFHPNDDEPMLKISALRLELGQMIGVVGATGAGKSTLGPASIPRLFDPARRFWSRLAATGFK